MRYVCVSNHQTVFSRAAGVCFTFVWFSSVRAVRAAATTSQSSPSSSPPTSLQHPSGHIAEPQAHVAVEHSASLKPAASRAASTSDNEIDTDPEYQNAAFVAQTHSTTQATANSQNNNHHGGAVPQVVASAAVASETAAVAVARTTTTTTTTKTTTEADVIEKNGGASAPNNNSTPAPAARNLEAEYANGNVIEEVGAIVGAAAAVGAETAPIVAAVTGKADLFCVV